MKMMTNDIEKKVKEENISPTSAESETSSDGAIRVRRRHNPNEYNKNTLPTTTTTITTTKTTGITGFTTNHSLKNHGNKLVKFFNDKGWWRVIALIVSFILVSKIMNPYDNEMINYNNETKNNNEHSQHNHHPTSQEQKQNINENILSFNKTVITIDMNKVNTIPTSTVQTSTNNAPDKINITNNTTVDTVNNSNMTKVSDNTNTMDTIKAIETIEAKVLNKNNDKNNDDNTLKSSSSSSSLLRIDWLNLEPLLPLARRMVQHQKNCSLPLANFAYQNQIGLGSDLKLWSQGLCNGLESNHRIRTVQPWIYWDQNACIDNMNNNNNNNDTEEVVTLTGNGNLTVQYPSKSYLSSSMTCYFPKTELLCPNDIEIAQSHPTYDNDDTTTNISNTNTNLTKKPLYNLVGPKGWPIEFKCESLIRNYRRDKESIKRVGKAATEFLFTSLSPIVVEEAYRQLSLVFPQTTTTNSNNNSNVSSSSSSLPYLLSSHGTITTIPKDLITVHIRWGDKKYESHLTAMKTYIDAIHKILERRKNNSKNDKDTNHTDNTTNTFNNNDNDIVNIFLATEDPKAIKEFNKMKLSNWNIYIDQYYTEMLPHRINMYNGHAMTSKNVKGRTGLIALGSLLLALEANDYILTTTSNWSHLINQLRQTIIDPRCNNCTTLIDLYPRQGW